MLTNVRCLPTLNGPVLLDGVGMPRYWVTVWSAFLPGQARSTLTKQLRAVERFYVFSDNLYGAGALDNALADFDMTAVGRALEAYFISLRNDPTVAVSSEDSLQIVLRFLKDILNRMARSSPSLSFQDNLLGRLAGLERLNGDLHVTKRGKPQRVRSLPAEVVEALYELLDPAASSNPFRPGRSRWQVYVIFILLLHQGLRLGELLCLTADAVKSGFDKSFQRGRFWMTVQFNPYEDDCRSSTPSIKTVDSFRQLPLSESMVHIVEQYSVNYRGRPDHSFLLNSQKNLPLSVERVEKIFQKIKSALPRSALRVLQDRHGHMSITPHDLRHTCAVLRLHQLLDAGVAMEEAMQQLRSFFGWSRSSVEPLRYARTVLTTG